MGKYRDDVIILVNGAPVPYVPDSLKIDQDGSGEEKVNAVNIGAGVTDIMSGKDVSTKVSKITFSMPSTEEAELLFDVMKGNSGLNLVQQLSRATSWTISRATVLNQLTQDMKTEGVIPVEISGDPIIRTGV
jgi:hypothetical protein